MMMKFITMLGVFACLICNVFSTQVTQCKTGYWSTSSLPTSVSISNCRKTPCVFRKGDRVWINMTFTSDHSYAALEHNVYATVNYVVQYTYPNLHGTSVCPFLKPTISRKRSNCVIVPGQKYSYAIQLKVDKRIPVVTAPIHYAIRDADKNEDVACFEMVVQIVK